jgi:DNA-binding transcriptional LysR family regulator
MRFAGRPLMQWEFERSGETVRFEPSGPLIVQASGGGDLAIEAAVAGTGIVAHFEDWLRPYFETGALEPVLEEWWQRFDGPFLYYPGRRLVPAPLRAFVDFIKSAGR